MVDVAVRGEGERGGMVLENRDIQAMAGSLHPFIPRGDPAESPKF
jgi:hypothetical protein